MVKLVNNHLNIVIENLNEMRIPSEINQPLIFPVWRTCGPRHKSISGPHRYTVVVSVLTFWLRIRTLNSLYLNISSRSDFFISNRSNGCFSFIIFLTKSSITLKSPSVTWEKKHNKDCYKFLRLLKDIKLIKLKRRLQSHLWPEFVNFCKEDFKIC